MQPAMPQYLKVATHHVSRNGTETSVGVIGYLYDQDECTWELRAPVEFLEKIPDKDHTYIHNRIGIDCGPTVTADRYCCVLCD